MTIDKKELYHICIEKFRSQIEYENNFLANAANLCAILKEGFDHHWIGYYFAYGDLLILGPFQGPQACNRIPLGKGVCGHAWAEKKSIIVDDVHQYPGHIACSSLSNSEIVIPLYFNNEVIGVLDIDSTAFAHFDSIDQQYLESVTSILIDSSVVGSFYNYLSSQ